MCFEAKRLCKLALGPVLMLMTAMAMAAGGEASSVNMPAGVTDVGKDIYDLHMLILIICTVIGAGVFGVMFYSIIYHRKSRGCHACHLPREHQGGNRLDGGALHHIDRHGLSRHVYPARHLRQ